MRTPDPRWPTFGLTLLAAGCTADPGFRYTAPVTLEQPAPFIRLALPPEAYRRIVQPTLADLLLVDSRGERVPFAVLDPVEAVERVERAAEATLYPLPARRASDGSWQSPVEVSVSGDRIEVRRRGGPPGPAELRPGGWLIDLGQRSASDPRPDVIRVGWAGAAEFTASFDVETSDDLRQWRPAGSGQLLSLDSPRGPLTQPAVVLPADGGRFVRLIWTDPAAAPPLVRAQGVSTQHRSITLDSLTEITATPRPAPNDSALDFDLGGALTASDIALRLGAGTRVAPVRLQGRSRADEPWHELGLTVFYRLERDGAAASTSPPFPVGGRVRFLRATPDPRAAKLDPATTTLVARVQLATLVFANQGQPPFTLHAGSAAAPSAALPVGALVPDLERERAKFGRATLGGWSEVASVARAAEWRQRMARIRPWLLWAVLVAGVLGLSVMVWRLARGPSAA